MDIKTIIQKKRSREALNEEEIRYFISKLTRDEITEGQAAALMSYIYVNGMNEDELVYCVSVLHLIAPSRKSKTSARIEYSRNCRNYTNNLSKTYAFYNHLFLRQKCKAAGDIEIKHQPDTYVVCNFS